MKSGMFGIFSGGAVRKSPGANQLNNEAWAIVLWEIYNAIRIVNPTRKSEGK